MFFLSLTAALAGERNLLFVGNSYTMAGNLDQAALALFVEGAATDHDLAVRVATPGYTFPMHLADADGTNGDTPARDALVSGDQGWTWVILQDQSQIPGFPADEPDVVASLAALPALDAMVAAKGGQSMFLMTWGRRAGDDQNPDLYPDFRTMQARLATGYEAYAASITTADRIAWVAPAGYAFQHVYETTVAAGDDPLAEDALFSRMYQVDGSHPSALGTYAVSCVVYSSITGNRCTGLSAPPELAGEDVAALQSGADAAVFDDWPELAYPWQSSDDPKDTGGVDTATGDTAAPREGPVNGNLDSSDASRCGCESAAAPVSSGSFALLTLLFPLTRRRSPLCA